MSQTEDEFRANLIEVGRDAMGRNDGWRWWHPRHLARLLDFWEPLIRADERERQTAMCAAAVAERDAARAEVRALLHIRALMEKDRDAAARETLRVVSEVQAERDAARAKVASFSADERRKVAHVANVHQFHGTECLCGFDSHGRSRSMTEHILGEVLVLIDGSGTDGA